MIGRYLLIIFSLSCHLDAPLLAEKPQILQAAYSPSSPGQVFLWVQKAELTNLDRMKPQTPVRTPPDEFEIYVGTIDIRQPLTEQELSFRKLEFRSILIEAQNGKLSSLTGRSHAGTLQWKTELGLKISKGNSVLGTGRPIKEVTFLGRSSVLRERLSKMLSSGRLTLSKDHAALDSLEIPTPPRSSRLARISAATEAEIKEARRNPSEWLVSSGSPSRLFSNVFRLKKGFLILRDNSFVGRDLLEPIQPNHRGWILVSGELHPFFSDGEIQINDNGLISMVRSTIPPKSFDLDYDLQNAVLWLEDRSTPLILPSVTDPELLRRLATAIIEDLKPVVPSSSRPSIEPQFRFFRPSHRPTTSFVALFHESGLVSSALVGTPDYITQFPGRIEIFSESDGTDSLLIHATASLDEFRTKTLLEKVPYIWIAGSQANSLAAQFLGQSHVVYGNGTRAHLTEVMNRRRFLDLERLNTLGESCRLALAALLSHQ